MLIVSDDIHIPLSEFEFTFARSGGPGGQNVNKVSSKAVLRWQIVDSPSISEGVKERFMETYASRVSTDGYLVISSQRYRDQKSNIDNCLEKLREMLLAVEEEPRKRRPTRPSRTVEKKRAEEKRRHSRKKESRKPPSIED